MGRTLAARARFVPRRARARGVRRVRGVAGPRPTPHPQPVHPMDRPTNEWPRAISKRRSIRRWVHLTDHPTANDRIWWLSRSPDRLMVHSQDHWPTIVRAGSARLRRDRNLRAEHAIRAEARRELLPELWMEPEQLAVMAGVAEKQHDAVAAEVPLL